MVPANAASRGREHRTARGSFRSPHNASRQGGRKGSSVEAFLANPNSRPQCSAPPFARVTPLRVSELEGCCSWSQAVPWKPRILCLRQAVAGLARAAPRRAAPRAEVLLRAAVLLLLAVRILEAGARAVARRPVAKRRAGARAVAQLPEARARTAGRRAAARRAWPRSPGSSSASASMMLVAATRQFLSARCVST